MEFYEYLKTALVIGVVFILTSCSPEKKPLTDLPEGLPSFEIEIKKGEVFEGYIFVRQENPGAQVMINEDGDVFWYLLSDTTIFRPFMPYSTSFISQHTDLHAYEISYSGDTINQWKHRSPLHHEILLDEDGNTLALTYKYERYDLSEQGGIVDDSLRIDGILKISPEGDEIWSWFVNDIPDSIDMNETKERYLGHSNSLMVDADGNYLVSWKNFNEVWKINSIDGAVIWKYGDRDSLAKRDWITGQHSLSRNFDGDYMVLDNGSEITRAFGFNYDQKDGFGSTLSIELPDSLFTVKKGSVYQFSEDRFLFCSAQTGSLVITDKSGEILWLASSSHQFYRAYYLPPDVID